MPHNNDVDSTLIAPYDVVDPVSGEVIVREGDKITPDNVGHLIGLTLFLGELIDNVPLKHVLEAFKKVASKEK